MLLVELVGGLQVLVDEHLFKNFADKVWVVQILVKGGKVLGINILISHQLSVGHNLGLENVFYHLVLLQLNFGHKVAHQEVLKFQHLLDRNGRTTLDLGLVLGEPHQVESPDPAQLIESDVIANHELEVDLLDFLPPFAIVLVLENDVEDVDEFQSC